MSMTRTSPLSLLDLPAEVRLRIYHFLIPQGHRFCIKRDNGLWVFEKESCSTEPLNRTGAALFRVHSTFNHEATVLLYSQNNFSFRTAKDAAHWFRVIGRQNAGLIRYLDLYFGDVLFPSFLTWDVQEDMRSFNRIVSQLSGIRSLTFNGIRPDFITRKRSIPHLSFAKHIEKRLPWLTRFSHSTADAKERFWCLATEDAERRVDVSAFVV